MKIRVFLLLGLLIGVSISHFDLPAEQKGVKALDCRNQSFTCEESEISQVPSSCSRWYERNPYSQLNCNYTTEEVERVSLITDPANYVDIPKTNAKYRTEFVARTGPNPWDLDFLPSGDPIWTNMKSGEIQTLENGSATTLDEIRMINTSGYGLLGLAIDPEYTENDFIYLYYTSNRTEKSTLFAKRNENLDLSIGEKIFRNRISRFKLEDGKLKNEKVLVEVPGSGYHLGGRLEFGPDGKLYASTGDAKMLYQASNRSFLGGKILRINSNGTVPRDNPFDDSLVYSMGHRNPQGLAWNPETQVLYNTEHGQWRHDEINLVEAGGKYGWSGFKCGEKNSIFGAYSSNITVSPKKYYDNTPPVYCWDNWTMAPSGATFVDDPGHRWHGDLFVAGLRGKQVFRLKFQDGKPADAEIFYVSGDEPGISLRLRDVEYHDDSLYIIGDTKGMVRIIPAKS